MGGAITVTGWPRAAHAALLFFQCLFGASVMAEFLESRWVGLGVVLVAGAQGALAAYQRGEPPRNADDL